MKNSTSRRLRFLLAAFFFALYSLFGCPAFSQCNVTPLMENDTAFYTIAGAPGVTYDWTVTFLTPTMSPLTGSGNSIQVPIFYPLENSYFLLVTPDGSPTDTCFIAKIDIIADCSIRTAFDDCTEINDCQVSFVPNDICINLNASINYTWDFGDGSPQTHDPSPIHTYDSPGGSFEVTLWNVHYSPPTISTPYYTIKFINCTDTITVECASTFDTLEVNTMEVLDCGKLTVCFSTNFAGCEHEWTFGNCGNSTEDAPLFVFENINTYPDGTPSIPVSLTITCEGEAPFIYNFTYYFENQGIFAGDKDDPLAVFSMDDVVSCQDGDPLFPGDSLDRRNIYIYSTMSVDKHPGTGAPNFSYAFSSCKVEIHECAGINVGLDATHSPMTQSFYKLYIRDSSLVQNPPGCCLWRGINVYKDGYLAITTDTEVRDAMYAVRTAGGGTSGNQAGIRLENSTFTNNWISWIADRNFRKPQFQDNLFQGDSLLDCYCSKAPVDTTIINSNIETGQNVTFSQLQPYAGLYWKNVTEEFGCDPGTGPVPYVCTDNLYTRIANGVYLKNCTSVDMRFSSFSHIWPYPYGSDVAGNGIKFHDVTGGHQLIQTDATFDSVKVGIHSYITALGSHLRSSGNTMTNMRTGYRFRINGSLTTAGGIRPILVSNDIQSTYRGISFEVENAGQTNRLDVFRNDFNMLSGIGVSLTSPAATTNQDVEIGNTLNSNTFVVPPGKSIGITANSFRGGDIEGNLITLNGGVDNASRGINLTGGLNTDVLFNEVRGRNPLLEVYDNDETYGINTEDNDGDTYYGNETDSLHSGIRFDGTSPCEDDIDCNKMRYNNYGLNYEEDAVTDPQEDGGNSWSVNNKDVRHEGPGAFEMGLSKYITHFSQDPLSWEIPSGTSITDWFVTGGDSVGCGIPGFTDEEVTERNFPSETLSLFDTLTAQGDETLGINWLGRQHLYRKLKAWPELLEGNDLMQEFMNNNEDAALGHLYNIGEQLKAAFSLSSEQQVHLDVTLAEIDVLLADITELNAQLAIVAPDSDEEAALLAAKAEKLAALDEQHAALSALHTEWMQQRNMAADVVEAANESIANEADYDGNEKLLNGLYAATILRGLPVNWQERQQILAIALQCPEQGGIGVYRARAWYAHLTGITLWEGEPCTEGGNFQPQQPSGSSGAVQVFPNPSNGTFVVRGPVLEAEENWKIGLYNAFGGEMARFGYDASGHTVISQDNLPSGMYWCRILANGQQLNAVKIIVLH